MFKKLTLIIICGIIMCFSNLFADSPKAPKTATELNSYLKDHLKLYSSTVLKTSLKDLTERERKMVLTLIDAGKLADRVFWKQQSADGLNIKDSLARISKPLAKETLKYVVINAGPYDMLNENLRFVGNGPEKMPAQANLYPLDMTKDEFETYIKNHPDKKSELESQYTVVKRQGSDLVGVPYYKAYPEIEQIAKLLEQAASYCDDQPLKKYLLERAKAFRTDNYFQSDMDWMDVIDSDVDLVVGPIENYLDGLYNYKTAWEAGVFVKDKEGTAELQMLKQHIDDLEHRLPSDKKYIRKSAGGSTTLLSVVNVAYFGGDFQEGVKTIATSLPNDPTVHELKGAKKLMFKNMMEAKFDKIVKPIADILLDKSILKYVDGKAFTSFVTLHEVSHTLGRGFVYGNDSLSVRQALKERFSTIEECKADILGMYNHKSLLEMGFYKADYVKQAVVTYLAGIFRSVRFGAEEAHGVANVIQLNFLTEKGAIYRKGDKWSINEKIFFDKVAELSKILLEIEAQGDYQKAGDVITKYGSLSPIVKADLQKIKDIPSDIDTKYIAH